MRRGGECEGALVPRYFFNLYDDVNTLDEEGIQLRDQATAEAFGLTNARAIAADQVRQGKLALWHRIEVADESGAVLKTIRFVDAVKVEHG